MSRSARRVLTHAPAGEVSGLSLSGCSVVALLSEVQSLYDRAFKVDPDTSNVLYGRIPSITDAAMDMQPESIDGVLGHLFLILDTAAQVSAFEMDTETLERHMERITRSVVWMVDALEKATGRDGRNIGREWFISGTEAETPAN